MLSLTVDLSVEEIKGLLFQLLPKDFLSLADVIEVEPKPLP